LILLVENAAATVTETKAERNIAPGAATVSVGETVTETADATAIEIDAEIVMTTDGTHHVGCRAYAVTTVKLLECMQIQRDCAGVCSFSVARIISV